MEYQLSNVWGRMSSCAAIGNRRQPRVGNPLQDNILPHKLFGYVHAHAARRAFYAAHGRFQIETVEIRHLDLGDLFHLLGGDLAHLILIRLSRPLRQIHGTLDQNGNRRSLGDKGEGAIAENGDHNRNDQPFLILGRRLGVERLAELHDIHALGTECGTYRGRRRGLASRNLQLYLRSNFFCHVGKTLFERPYIFSTCRKSNSTGVARPKIVTSTRSVLRSELISSILPEKLANGPSMIFTDSFFSK